MAADKQQPDPCLPLPEMPVREQGTSTARTHAYTATVSNAAGYLCHIQLECTFDVPPEIIFEVFCHPDNAGAFRDIKRVGYRKVISSAPGLKRVEVEQCGELRVAWVNRVFRTYLDVVEDSRDPECLKTEFTLLRSDILSRFHGAWELRPQRDAAGNVVACRATLSQDVLPRGVPSFFAHLPVLGGLLRRVSLSTIQRLVEDILNIIKRYTAGDGKLSIDDVLAQIALERGHKTRHEEDRPERLSDAGYGGAAAAAAGSSNNNHSSSGAAVNSFALTGLSDDDSSSESSEAAAGAGGKGGAEGQAGAGAPAASPRSRKHVHRPLAVLLDVTTHGHVHVVLMPRPEGGAAPA